jgi:hypothetical protein
MLFNSNLRFWIGLLLLTGSIVKEIAATGSGCWVASTGLQAADITGTVGTAYCKTTIPTGVAVEVANAAACTPSATEACCLITATGTPCNKVTTCNNPKAGGAGTITCTNTAGAAGDLACAILISDGTGTCQSATSISGLTAANYIIVYAVANGAGGTSMKCWDPSTTASVTCSASQWTCQTTISSGKGACTTTPGTSSSTTYYCSGTTAKPNECNNFAGIQFCFDPATLALAPACTNAQWQCSTSNTGTGTCVGTAPTSSVYTCGIAANCNQISTCWNPTTNAVLSTACTPTLTKSCQNMITAGVYAATCSPACTPSATGVTPVVTCCYYTNCNKPSSAIKSISNFKTMFATSLMLLLVASVY